MERENVKQMITTIRQNNGILGMMDKYKDKCDTKTLNDVYKEFEKDYKVDLNQHAFFNQYQFICSLYAYIVLPKEALFKNIPKNLSINELNQNWGLTSLNKTKMKFDYFLRRLRNAISHGNVECDENLVFHFRDEDKYNYCKDEFNIKIGFEDLRHFVQALAWWVMTNDITLNKLRK